MKKPKKTTKTVLKAWFGKILNTHHSSPGYGHWLSNVVKISISLTLSLIVGFCVVEISLRIAEPSKEQQISQPSPPKDEQPKEEPQPKKAVVCKTEYIAVFDANEAEHCAHHDTAQRSVYGAPDENWFPNGEFLVEEKNLLEPNICDCLSELPKYEPSKNNLPPIGKLKFNGEELIIEKWVCSDRRCFEN